MSVEITIQKKMSWVYDSDNDDDSPQYVLTLIERPQDGDPECDAPQVMYFTAQDAVFSLLCYLCCVHIEEFYHDAFYHGNTHITLRRDVDNLLDYNPKTYRLCVRPEYRHDSTTLIAFATAHLRTDTGQAILSMQVMGPQNRLILRVN